MTVRTQVRIPKPYVWVLIYNFNVSLKALAPHLVIQDIQRQHFKFRGSAEVLAVGDTSLDRCPSTCGVEDLALKYFRSSPLERCKHVANMSWFGLCSSVAPLG